MDNWPLILVVIMGLCFSVINIIHNIKALKTRSSFLRGISLLNSYIGKERMKLRLRLERNKTTILYLRSFSKDDSGGSANVELGIKAQPIGDEFEIALAQKLNAIGHFISLGSYSFPHIAVGADKIKERNDDLYPPAQSLF